MKLSLSDEDLKPEHRGCSANQVTFEMLMKLVQMTIIFAGKGTYFSPDGKSHKVIYKPEYEDDKKKPSHPPASKPRP
jgi:hypothetical protein